jgi:hypothetical protein
MAARIDSAENPYQGLLTRPSTAAAEAPSPSRGSREPRQTQKAICVCQVLRMHTSRAGGRALQRTPRPCIAAAKQKKHSFLRKGGSGEGRGGRATQQPRNCALQCPQNQRKSRAQQRLAK